MVTSPGKEAVELVGEKVPVALSERRGAAEERAGRAKVVHQVAYGEALADIVLGIQLPSRVEGMPSTSDDLGGEGNIGGDHQISRLELLHDAVIGHVEALAPA